MEIGIGLPTVLQGADGRTVLEWARRAESRGFSTLGVIDRIAYPNYEVITALAAAAGATGSIRLMTDVLLLPTRDPVLLAKQAASLAQLSGGRFTMGIGVGAREDDYAVVGKDFHARGRECDAALALMDRIWKGEPPEGTTRTSAPVEQGPHARPLVMIGGTADAAVARTVRWGDGWTASGGIGDGLAAFADRIRQAWREAGRTGEPRISALTYFACGDDERAAKNLALYYGPQAGDRMAKNLGRTPDGLRALVRRFEDAGIDEVVPFPTIPDVAQVDRLADAVLC